jgi:hypothetical protein
MAGRCHGAHCGEGPVLAILAMLTPPGTCGADREGLRVAPGCSGPPIPSVALHGLLKPSGRRAGSDSSTPPGGSNKGLWLKGFPFVAGLWPPHPSEDFPVIDIRRPGGWGFGRLVLRHRPRRPTTCRLWDRSGERPFRYSVTVFRDHTAWPLSGAVLFSGGHNKARKCGGSEGKGASVLNAPPPFPAIWAGFTLWRHAADWGQTRPQIPYPDRRPTA